VPRDDIAVSLLLALHRHDDVALAAILSPDVRLVVDSGDAGGRELTGRVRVSRALNELTIARTQVEVVSVNGGPGLARRDARGEVVGVLGIDVAGGGRAGTGNGGGTVGSSDDGRTVRGSDDGRTVGGGAHVADAVIEALWLCTAPAKLASWNRQRPGAD
jgi:hypothetical protein